jgi:membrane protein
MTAETPAPQLPDERSVGQLVSDASEQLSRLVREEMRLAAVELQQKGKRLGVGAGLFGGAGVLAAYGVGVLIACAVLALSLVLAPWLAALIVGVVVLAVAGVSALVGRSQVKQATPPVPQAAAGSVKKDIEAVKEGLHQ